MPARQSIHIDRALTNISVAYMQDDSAFIADKVFPMIPVVKQSDTYFVYNRDDFFRDEAEERAKGTESAGGDYDIEEADPYFCRKYAFHMDVTEEDRVNADNPLTPNQDATDFVSRKLMLRRENLWAQKFFVPGKWGTQVQGVAATPGAGETIQWNSATSDPVKFIRNQTTQGIERTGYKFNTLVLSPYTYDELIEHEDIIDRIKYTEKGIATLNLLASLFEVDNIYVPNAIQNTKAKTAGAAAGTGNFSFIMGKHALLCYVEKKPGLKKPSAGYTFGWTGLLGAGAFGNRIVRIPMPWLGMETERVEGEMAFDMKIIGSELGLFLKDIVI